MYLCTHSCTISTQPCHLCLVSSHYYFSHLGWKIEQLKLVTGRVGHKNAETKGTDSTSSFQEKATSRFWGKRITNFHVAIIPLLSYIISKICQSHRAIRGGLCILYNELFNGLYKKAAELLSHWVSLQTEGLIRSKQNISEESYYSYFTPIFQPIALWMIQRCFCFIILAIANYRRKYFHNEIWKWETHGFHCAIEEIKRNRAKHIFQEWEIKDFGSKIEISPFL